MEQFSILSKKPIRMCDQVWRMSLLVLLCLVKVIVVNRIYYRNCITIEVARPVIVLR
jgi:hypothetical protein